MSKELYEHYFRGDYKVFDKALMEPIRNISIYSNKPKGGLWASKKDDNFNWKNWCVNELENGWCSGIPFIFSIKDNARILSIKTKEDVKQLNDYTYQIMIGTIKGIDFEEIAKKYDALEIYAGSNHELHMEFYGWDCDSIVIFNPEIIQEVENEER